MEAKRNIIVNKVGGTAGKSAVNYKLSIPADMIRALGVTLEDRSVTLICEDEKIIVKKSK